MTIFGKEQAIILRALFAVAVAAIQTASGSGFVSDAVAVIQTAVTHGLLSDAVAAKLTDIVKWLAELATLVAPLVAAYLIRGKVYSPATVEKIAAGEVPDHLVADGAAAVAPAEPAADQNIGGE